MKDDFVEDELALKAMFDLAKVWKQQKVSNEISSVHEIMIICLLILNPESSGFWKALIYLYNSC